MRYEPLEKYIKLSQGLAVNKGNAYLFSQTQSSQFPYPLLRIVDLENNNHTVYSRYVSKDASKSVIATKETIMFSRVTCQCFKGFEGVMHNNLFSVELLPNVDISKDYLYVALNSEFVKSQAMRFTSSSVVPDLTHNMFKQIRIPIFDSSTQKRIVHLYNSINKKIQTNNSTLNVLESMAKTIYDYWFLQFEFPNEDGKPYKSSGGKMVWNEELKREIPEGWKCDNIASLISNEKGGDWGKESLTNNYSVNVYCIRGADFPASTGCKDMNAPERWILEKNKWKELEYGDILVEISGGSPTQSTGRVCYVNNNYLQRFNKPVITSNFCRALSLKTPDYYSWFYLMWKTLYENDLFFNYEGKTTGLKNLLFDTAVNEIKIPLPEKRILDKFVEKINPFYENIQFCCQQNKELASLRDFLLPMLMNGQVTFKEDE